MSSTMAHAGTDANPPSHEPAGLGPHLLQLHGLGAGELRGVLARARLYAGHDADGARDPSGWRERLAGRVVANLFFEDSTRTRVSFALAAERLGARVVNLTSVGSSVSKGESLVDTALNVAAMGVDAVVMRHRSSGAPHLVARALAQRAGDFGAGGLSSAGSGAGVPSIVNAGDGKHEHPTQGLLDIYTVAQRTGRLDAFDLAGLTVGIVGDIASSRVARSNIAGLVTLGARVVCIGPPTLVPRGLASLGATLTSDLDGVLPGLDAINVLRIQFERHESAGAPGPSAANPGLVTGNVIASVREYHELYGLTVARLRAMKPLAVVMHPGPINRGVEISSEAADSVQSAVLAQVRHGVAVRMAVLERCLVG
jgi:aspartate carbamoyltransferase catalytic subunit